MGTGRLLPIVSLLAMVEEETKSSEETRIHISRSSVFDDADPQHASYSSRRMMKPQRRYWIGSEDTDEVDLRATT
jgi:hypothetical protein